MSAFDDVLAEAVAYFIEHGFKNEEEYRAWERRISDAIDAKMRAPGFSEKLLKEHLEAIFNRLVQQGTVLKYHGGVKKFTVDRVAPHLRAELTKRIMASADLIKLNRQKMRQLTMQRFSGWATSIPAGGAAEANKREIKAEISKPLKQLPFNERRVLIDQGHKLNASISAVIAKDAGAIAGRWFSHAHRQPGYDFRPEHAEREGKIYLIRGSWAVLKGFVKVGAAGWSDAITQPAEEPFCRCKWVYLYHLRQLPEELLTKAGKEALEKSRIEAA
jgi:hypothetical protein